MRESAAATSSRPAGKPGWSSASEPAGDYLEVLSGPEDGKVFAISEPTMSIGRMEDNDICVPLELSVSRRHARLLKSDGGYSLEILSGARNAATVNGVRVEPGESAVVATGGRFLLGDVLFELGAGTK